MDVSLRQWPIFVTGLLLGAAGAMSLGLHRLTEAERAALAPPVATPAVVAPVAATVEAAPAEEINVAAEAFRTQELLAAASLVPPRPRVRRVVKQVEPDLQAIAVALPVLPEPVEEPRPDTSVMGAAPTPSE